MKKFFCFLFRLVATLAVLAAAVYAVVAYWDKLTELWARAQSRVLELKDRYIKQSEEFEDFQDWEE